MKTPLIIGLVLAFAGWMGGRHLGSLTARVTTRDSIGSEKRTASDPATELHPKSNEHPLAPAALREVIKSLPKDSTEFAQLDALFQATERLSSEEFPAAMEAIKDLKGWWQGKLLDIWTEREPVVARKWFEQRPAEERRMLFTAWATTWARVDAPSMVRWLNTRPEDERAQLQKLQANHLAEALAEADGPAALGVARSYPTLVDVPTVLGVWAIRDPRAAAANALQESGGVRLRAIHSIVRQWGAKDPKAAQAWIDELKDPAFVKAARETFRNPNPVVDKNP